MNVYNELSIDVLEAMAEETGVRFIIEDGQITDIEGGTNND